MGRDTWRCIWPSHRYYSLVIRLVGVLDKRWSQVLPSLYVLQSRLEKLSVTYVDNEVRYVGKDKVLQDLLKTRVSILTDK